MVFQDGWCSGSCCRLTASSVLIRVDPEVVEPHLRPSAASGREVYGGANAFFLKFVDPQPHEERAGCFLPRRVIEVEGDAFERRYRGGASLSADMREALVELSTAGCFVEREPWWIIARVEGPWHTARRVDWIIERLDRIVPALLA